MNTRSATAPVTVRFSALQRAEIAEIGACWTSHALRRGVSVLFNEPKLLKWRAPFEQSAKRPDVSVLFNEPKLLKYTRSRAATGRRFGFSALQRAEIAEIDRLPCRLPVDASVSVLFNEPKLLKCRVETEVRVVSGGFSALQRAEIAEIVNVSPPQAHRRSFSALQRAEIAEIHAARAVFSPVPEFQCSSTSRNC